MSKTKTVLVQGVQRDGHSVRMELPQACERCMVIVAADPHVRTIGAAHHGPAVNHACDPECFLWRRETFGVDAPPAEIHAWLAGIHGQSPVEAIDWQAAVDAVETPVQRVLIEALEKSHEWSQVIITFLQPVAADQIAAGWMVSDGMTVAQAQWLLESVRSNVTAGPKREGDGEG